MRFRLTVLLTVLLTAGVSYVGSEYHAFILARIAVFSIAALSLGLIVAYGGRISLGHAAFLATGAYAHVLLYRAGVPLLLSMIGAIGASACLGYFAAHLSAPLKGPSFALATLAFQACFDQAISRFTGLTGGRMGLAVPPPSLAGPLTMRAYLPIAILVALVVALGIRRFSGTLFSRTLDAHREDELAAQSVGIDVERMTVMLLVFASGLAGLSGSLSAHLTDVLTPSHFGLAESVELLVIVTLGGARSIVGTVVASAAFVLLELTLASFARYQSLVMGLSLLVIAIVAPRGRKLNAIEH